MADLVKQGRTSPTDGSRLLWLLGGGVFGLLLLALVFREEVTEVVTNTFTSRTDFIKRIWQALGRSGKKEVGTAQKAIIVAQAVHEAGWGIASASRKGYNYWNLTAGPYWKGPVVIGPDTEYDKTGKVKNISQKFRQYRSDDEAVADFLKFIGPGTRYAKAWEQLVKGNAMEYLAELYAAGFFTQPLPLYQKAVRDSLRTVVTATEGAPWA